MTADQPCAGCGCEAEHDGDYGASGHPGPCPPHTCSRPPVTADHTPERLSAEEREALLVPCACGHTLNDHGDLAGCWLCPEENRECDVTCEALIVAGVERILAAHLADVEARLFWNHLWKRQVDPDHPNHIPSETA